ncbi:MAG: alpha/beta hydrolase [Acidobacteriota bacterium]
MSASPLDPGLAAYYARLNAELGPLPPQASAAQRRARIEEVGRRERRPYPPSLEVSDHYLALPGRELAVRLYRPASRTAPALLVYFHGGGWVIGSIASHDRLAAELASGSGVAIASVHYRRAPETPFPGPCDDATAALALLAEMAPELGCDPTQLGVGGDSSGAHLAIGAALDARDSGRTSLRFQLLIYPALDPACDSASYRRYGTAGPLTTTDMQWFWRQFLGEQRGTTDPRIAPLQADLAGLPPAYVLTAELDPLRDEGEAFGERLQRAGVPTQIVRAPGLVHGFARLTAHSDAAAAAVAAAAHALGAALA